MAQATQSGSMGLYFALESKIPSFEELYALRLLPVRERWNAMKQYELFIDAPDQAEVDYISEQKHLLEMELQGTLSTHTFVYDLIWFQKNMPALRKVIRAKRREIQTAEQFDALVAEHVPESSYITEDLIVAWSEIECTKDTFAIERILDKMQLQRLNGYYLDSSAFIRRYIELMIEHYNTLTAARMDNLGVAKDALTAFTIEHPNPGNVPLQGTLEELFEQKKDVFAEANIVPKELLDLEKIFAIEEVQHVKQAVFAPSDEAVALHYAKLIEYVFYNLQLLLFSTDEHMEYMLVDYDSY